VSVLPEHVLRKSLDLNLERDGYILLGDANRDRAVDVQRAVTSGPGVDVDVVYVKVFSISQWIELPSPA
jgi:hypothetical protein